MQSYGFCLSSTQEDYFTRDSILNGLLNFACSVVVPGRAFLRRLIDLTKGIKSAHHFVRLTKSVKADLEICPSSLEDFNGRSIFLSDVWTDSFTLNLYTDAAGTVVWVSVQSLAAIGFMAGGLKIGSNLILLF